MFREQDERLRALKLLCARMPTFVDGITGYSIKKEIDKFALLQHYFEISPVLDLTSDPLIALYFATLNYDATQQQVIYAFDPEDFIKSGLELSDHRF